MVEVSDIVVVGGGPAGATVAGLLALGGVRVTVCEGKVFPREKVCGEFVGTRVRPVLGRLGLLSEFEADAGPTITRVVAWAPGAGVAEVLTGMMPADGEGAFPRSLSRGRLDQMLLHRAEELGARVLMGRHVVSVEREPGGGFHVQTAGGALRTRVVVLAHGLAQRPWLNREVAARPLRRQYVSFKGHFSGCELAEDTIAIGGALGIYAGVVKSSEGRHSVAFVVRRERMEAMGNAAAAHLGALARENAGLGRIVRRARLLGRWMASGPLEPGVRQVYEGGRFFVGNAAGEVHALVGEGITLAMRGAEILAEVLLRRGLEDVEGAGAEYEGRWRREFAWRYGAAQLFANVMMRPALAAMSGRVLEAFPELLRACIRRSGK